MKDWHFILGAVLALFFSQGQYWANVAQYQYDVALGLPLLPYNPFASWPHVFDAAKELAICSLIAHVAINSPLKPFTRALWVFIGLSAWNQFVDSVWGDMTTFSISEGAFLIVAILAASITWRKWIRQRGLN